MKKLFTILLDAFLIFTIGFWLLLWYWFLVPYNPLEVKEPLIVLNENKTVVAGQELHYKVEFKKNTDIRPVIYRRLIDGLVYNFPPTYPKNEPGEYNSFTFLTIPKAIPEGNYILDSEACYQVNPIREVCVEYKSEEFRVIK